MNERAASPRPIVAILTVRDARKVPFRGNLRRFVTLLDAARAHKITAYIVTDDAMHVHDRRISGYRYDIRKKRWIRSMHPFPHIVYNRIPFRAYEKRPAIARLIRTCLQHPHLHFYNPGFLSKWTLFQWMIKTPELRKLLPETVRIQHASDVATMVKKHGTVYAKPITGRAGKGIIRIRMHTASSYEVRTQTGSPTTYDTVPTLCDALSAMFGAQPYIVQQGIPLATTSGRPFDLRAHVQKDGNGAWRVSGIGARVAGAHRITTHVPRGGSIGLPRNLLQAAFGAAKAKRVLTRVRKHALRIAAHIERQAGNTWGELSMDIGVDGRGRIWFFEANAKPMPFDERHIQRRALTRLVRYWSFLAKQKKNTAQLQGWFPLTSMPWDEKLWI
jgi:hypothetical protein